MTEYLSEFLLFDEFKCGHCGLLPPDLFVHDIKRPYSELFNIFDSVRERWGKPIPVSSGYRCPHHNKTIGGSQLSIHMWGLALDMDLPSTQEVEELYHLIDMDFNHLRIGKYTESGSFIHIDIGYEVTPRASHSWIPGTRWFK